MIRRLLSRRRRLSRIGQSLPPRWLPAQAPVGDHPRLGVYCAAPGYWWWQITAPGGELLDTGHVPTHGQALAVGLAALEAASLRGPAGAGYDPGQDPPAGPRSGR